MPKRNEALNVLSNPAAEKGVLCACYNGGIDTFYEVADIIKPTTFCETNNELFYCCIKHIYDVMKIRKPDIASLQSAAHELGIAALINRNECAQHFRQIIDLTINTANVRKFAVKIRKLEVARLLHKQLEAAQDKILEVTGSENVSEILNIAEDAVFNFTSKLDERDNDPVPIVDGMKELMDELRENPVAQPGISTGFKFWDACIGGGLRGGTVNVIGARAKGFKSGLALNMSRNIAMSKMPVLYMDTEMRLADQQPRLIASYSKTAIRDIETGQFGQSDSVTANVFQSVEDLKEKCGSFYYKNISGYSFEEQLSVMRRWIYKTVGVDTDRRANPCVIVYDYLKLMDSDGLNKLSEHQLLGFMMTQLHNFSIMYDIPILSFVQLNRDGIDNETAAAVSQSDRIIWLCANFSILKTKSDEEIARDGVEYGNFKLVPIHCRHGAGLPPKQYISLNAARNCAFIEETDLSINIQKLRETST